MIEPCEVNCKRAVSNAITYGEQNTQAHLESISEQVDQDALEAANIDLGLHTSGQVRLEKDIDLFDRRRIADPLLGANRGEALSLVEARLDDVDAERLELNGNQLDLCLRLRMGIAELTQVERVVKHLA